MSSNQGAAVQAVLGGIALVGTIVLAVLRQPIPDVLTHLDYALAGTLIGGALALPKKGTADAGTKP